VPLGGLPEGGVWSGGAPPGAVLGGVAFGAVEELALGAVLSGAVAGGGVWSDGPPGAVDCCFEQPAAIVSAAMDSKTRLRFMAATSLMVMIYGLINSSWR